MFQPLEKTARSWGPARRREPIRVLRRNGKTGVRGGRAVPLALGAALGIAATAAGCRDRRDVRALDLQYNWEDTREVPAGQIAARRAAAWPARVTSPSAIAVLSDGRIAVAGSDDVVLLNDRGEELRRFALRRPARGVAGDPDGRALYVVSRDRVEMLNLETGDSTAWSALGERAMLTSVAVSDAQVFVADAGQRIVHRFAPDGRPLGDLGARDAVRGAPGLVVPSPYLDVAIGPGDFVWVVNPGRRSIEKYRFDGAFDSAWQPKPEGIEAFPGCCNPAHIALRADGSFVTAEKGIPRVKLYGPDGTFIGVIAAPSEFDEQEDGLDLAALPDGRVLVLVPSRGEVRVYALAGKSTGEADDVRP